MNQTSQPLPTQETAYISPKTTQKIDTTPLRPQKPSSTPNTKERATPANSSLPSTQPNNLDTSKGSNPQTPSPSNEPPIASKRTRSESQMSFYPLPNPTNQGAP
eukprot:698199-Pelagomonas_calceolata.AAC.1